MICSACRCVYEATGKGGMCLACRRVYDREWRARRKAAGTPVISTKMPREYHREYGAAYNLSPDVRKRRAEQARIRSRDPRHAIRIAARLMVRNAIRRGDLARGPCECCGAEKVDAHHDDYEKPLAVRWLCRIHHSDLHAKAEGRS